ncbi:hypothetical protein [Curtobacterium flaccumfaciens]|jgi:hypothetical protein|uniref:hypothetical protein n=1 Tax=Curtobacterium flaccumfaciens TaxID=2035 RepID=UPI001BDF6E03|nr:hypothetical protein [Curtobacterium flaccumfaciens]MBT1607856.1 hypothetical protein [Curtobacterium flaccumfaciens pv. betae]MBT1657834.1 hypothetical protein [Curtobacterium flaccumfaciens pv. betae]MCS0470162.1 hypothetical protein [Curtobacterium flaccumfaciens pv. betae]MCS0475430.1 hypothetical protein [Curtobacterium flaccumfaciens pv. betae]MCS0477011.1 hypothetical protein [Curtobacterium flaccumfaciens pv. betae]
MSNLVLNGALYSQSAITDRVESMRDRLALKQDRVVVLVLIAIALLLAVGLITAWWITCQNKGMYPAMDMPSFSAGGTWKVYCRK